MTKKNRGCLPISCLLPFLSISLLYGASQPTVVVVATGGTQPCRLAKPLPILRTCPGL
jgi:hypothetical protein